MSDDEEQVVGENYNQDDDQSMEDDGMDELFGDDGVSGAEDQPAECDFTHLQCTSPHARSSRQVPADKLHRTKRPKGNARQLNDAELDSGDDEDRNDRMQVDEYEKDEEDAPKRELNVRETSIGRHSIPRGSDGEVYHQWLDSKGSNRLTSHLDLSP